MKAFSLAEREQLPRDPHRVRSGWIPLCLVAGWVTLVLGLLPLCLTCFLLHPKQAPRTCWVHGFSPEAAQTELLWKWTQNCSGFALKAQDSTVEIRETGMYFAYVYAARLEDVRTEDYFTVRLFAGSDDVLSLLRGPSDPRAFVNMGRPYFLESGMKLHLKINAGLGHIDCNQTYWGLFKI